MLQAITWINADQDRWHIIPSQGVNELTHWPLGAVALILDV